MLFAKVFLDTLGTRSLFTASSVDGLPHLLASYLLFGHRMLVPVPDLDRSHYVLMLGANPVVSNGSVMSAPGVARRLAELRARGGKLVVVDPRRTETAAAADRHLFIRPGGDALLLLAMLHTLFAEDRARPGRLADITDGIGTIRRLVRGFSPETVSARIGIASEDVRLLARELAASPAAVVYGRMGVSTQEFGALSCWLIHVLNIVTGNLDRAGGSMFTAPAVDMVPLARLLGEAGQFATYHSRVRRLPEFGRELPVAALAEEIDTPGAGQIRGLCSYAGNPVLSSPNGARLDRALGGLDFMVAIDYYRNETTRHADIILPPTSPLERDHYDLVFNLTAVRNTAKYSPALLEPPPDARHDWQIFLDLATSVRRRRSWLGRWIAWLKRGVLRRIGPRGLLDAALRLGPYGGRFLPLRRGLSLRALEREPHGIDLGPLRPALPARLCTPGRRIHLAPAPFVADLERLRGELDAAPIADPDELLLIGRRQLRSNNSWMHNSRRLVKGKETCTLLMHPDDAARRGLSDSQRVRVVSRVGAVEVPLTITDAIMPGTVSLPHGWGHDRPGAQLSVAAERPGVSANDLTDDARVDALAGTAVFSGVPVRVQALHPDA
jgi:anaerobic selenocysteine-containing dehydrogenase